MIFISHRGNIDGINKYDENKPKYIDSSLNNGFDVEIDIWLMNDILYLGHDEPQYIIDIDWLKTRKNKLWVHCKNIDAINYFISNKDKFNFFWHQNDDISLTSLNYIWAYPGKQPIKNSISVMPEINNDNLSECIGICSDFIRLYYDKINNF